MQVYSSALNGDVDGLMMWFTEGDGEKWSVMESSKMMILQVLR